MKPHEIAQFITESFAPYTCKVKLTDYDDRIRFKVLDKNNNKIIESPILLVEKLKENNNLEILIINYKNNIQKKGYPFNHNKYQL